MGQTNPKLMLCNQSLFKPTEFYFKLKWIAQSYQVCHAELWAFMGLTIAHCQHREINEELEQADTQYKVSDIVEFFQP